LSFLSSADADRLVMTNTLHARMTPHERVIDRFMFGTPLVRTTTVGHKAAAAPAAHSTAP